MIQRPCSGPPSSSAKQAPESNRGQRMREKDHARATRAAVWQSPINAYCSSGVLTTAGRVESLEVLLRIAFERWLRFQVVGQQLLELRFGRKRLKVLVDLDPHEVAIAAFDREPEVSHRVGGAPLDSEDGRVFEVKIRIERKATIGRRHRICRVAEARERSGKLELQSRVLPIVASCALDEAPVGEEVR